jgi:hypothetical protein
MKPFFRNGCTTVVFASLLFFCSSIAYAGNLNISPSQHPDFTLMDVDSNHVQIRYDQPDKNLTFKETALIYVGIPAGATYELTIRSWQISSSNKRVNDVIVNSEEISDATDQTMYDSILKSAIQTRKYAYQEINLVQVKIPSNYTISKTYGNLPFSNRSVNISKLDFDIHWFTGPNPKPESISTLDAGYNRLLKNICINQDQITDLRRKRVIEDWEKTKGFSGKIVGFQETASPINLAKELVPLRTDGARVRVRESGILAVRPNDLLREGIPLNRVKLDQARVWHKDEEIACLVNDDGNGIFDGSDEIIFYGKESTSEFTVDSQYFLTWYPLESPPKRIEIKPIEWKDESTKVTTVRKVYNDNSLIVKDGPNNYDWYLLDLEEKQNHFIFDLPHLAKEGEVKVRLTLFNNTRRACSFQSKIGNVTQEFDIAVQSVRNATTVEFIVSASEVIQSSNYAQLGLLDNPQSAQDIVLSSTLTLTLDKEPYKVPLSRQSANEKALDILRIFIKKIEFIYPRKTIIDDTLVLHRDVQGETVTPVAVDKFNHTRTASAWAVKPDGTTTRYQTDQIQLNKGILLPDDGWETIEVMYDDSIPGPYTVDHDYPSSLHMKNQGYHVLMITPRELIPAVQELAQYRINQGFDVSLIDIQDIYDEFNYGYPGYDAIKRFLRYTQSEWTGLSPDFVVLIGDSNWDHRDREGFGFTDMIPTYAPIENPQEYGTDEWYAYLWDHNDDHFSDVIIGRISVQRVEDFKKYFEKIQIYETQNPVGPWKSRNVFINDDGPFKRYAVSNVQNDLPPQFYPKLINQTDFPHVTNPYLYHRFMNNPDPSAEEYLNKKMSPECTLAILDEFNKGSLVIQYIGHGGNQLWSGERLFYGTDRPYSNVLELEPNNRFPFVISWSCLTGFLNFNQPPFTICLAEELVRYPDRGAIAVWGPSGNGTTNLHMILSRIVMRALTDDGLSRLGEATTYAKAEFMENSHNPGLINQYIMFGDPLIQLATPKENVEIEVTPEYCIENAEQSIKVEAKVSSFESGKQSFR